ncbi:PilX N-terminal domain-containing pilus assembly protein [Patescibacteria group bacterium]
MSMMKVRDNEQAPRGYSGQAPRGYSGQAPRGYSGQAPRGYSGQAPRGYSGQAPRGYSGQAALVVLLVMAVTLGFGLSIISQSTTDVRISSQEQESSRAFNAAEAGIEEALQDLSVSSAGLAVNGIDVNYTVAQENYLEGIYSENESAQVLLGGVNNTLTIEWAKSTSEVENPGNCAGVAAGSGQTAASLLITVVDDNDQVRRVGLNACDLSAANGMTNVLAVGADDYLRSYDLAVTSNDAYVRIRPIYNQASMRVVGFLDLPDQLYQIDSKAQTNTLESKAIEVTRTEPATPSIFDYVLFSGTSIVK